MLSRELTPNHHDLEFQNFLLDNFCCLVFLNSYTQCTCLIHCVHIPEDCCMGYLTFGPFCTLSSILVYKQNLGHESFGFRVLFFFFTPFPGFEEPIISLYLSVPGLLWSLNFLFIYFC